MKPIPSFFCQNAAPVDLAAFAPADVDFARIAARLGRINRFNGDGISVAQHLVQGAEALFRTGGDGVAAGYFLLHDAAEAYLGDDARPVIALYERDMPGFATARANAHARFETAILAAAGLPPIGAFPAYRKAVQAMDERMCRAEAVELYGEAIVARHFPKLDHPPITGTLAPWGPMKAEEAWLERLERWLGVVAK